MNSDVTGRLDDGSGSGPLGLREEARKLWNYSLTDKLVYLLQISDPQTQSIRFIPEDYINGESWCEIHFTLRGQEYAHYTAIVEFLDSGVIGRSQIGEIEISDVFVERDESVLAEITKFVQLPQPSILCGIPSVIRLKRFDNCDCVLWNSPKLPLDIPLTLKYREGYSSGKFPFFSGEQGQLENNVIQRSTEASSKISSDEREFPWRITQCDPGDVPSIFQVILTGKSVGFRILKNEEFSLEGIKVLFRPYGFEPGVSQIGHNEEKSDYEQRRLEETDHACEVTETGCAPHSGGCISTHIRSDKPEDA